MKIYAALEDDMGEGFVWLQKTDLPPRCIVKITNNQRSVYCETLQFDANFLKRYNHGPRFNIGDTEHSIVMNGWYRARLGGLMTQGDYPLEIMAADSWRGKLLACMDHPQIVVRVAIWLGILSVALGVVGAVLGVISLIK